MRTHRDEGHGVPFSAQEVRLFAPVPGPVTAPPTAPPPPLPVATTSTPATVFVVSRIDTAEHLHVSEGFESITGLPGSVLLGDATVMIRLIHPHDVQVAASWMQKFWAGRPGQVEMRIVRPDTEVRWVRMASAVLPVAGERRMITAIDDITERITAIEVARAAEASARAAHETKTALISRLSHELRTPLNAVIGFGQLLERRITDPDDQSSVQYILSSGRHLLAMIEEVLDVSRIGAGSASMIIEPVEAPSLIDEVVRLVQPAADRAGVALAVEGGPAGLRLFGDRQRLVQVLHNLIGDAIHDNAAGGRVRLSWSAIDGASVVVRHDGQRAPEDVRQPVVTPFDRRHAEASPVAGSGVGLSVARALVELMGGGISVDPAPGAGASFTVRLPAAPDRRVGVGTADEALVATEQGISPTTLLYIEDNEPNVRVVTSLLRLRPAWQMVHAASGGAGVEVARSRMPDVILLDLHLPDCFGLSVLETLKADPLTAGIPVVILSADASQSQVDRLLQVGAAQYLTKPLDVREVLMLLDGITADQLSRMVDA